MNKKGIVILLLSLFCSVSAFSQGTTGLRINEVMVQNDSNYVDDYGQKTAWIELFNSTRGTMKIASMYLTNDKNNPTKYAVPRGDVRTNIPPLQHIVFFADGDAGRGPFHMSFKLTPGQDNWIGLYAADGKTLIDEVVVPANLPANCSYALKNDGVNADEGKKGTYDSKYWEVRDGKNNYITPGSSNVVVEVNDSVEKFREHDSTGIVMTLMAMGIVFAALIVLSICFYFFGKLNETTAKKKKAAVISSDANPTSHTQVKGDSGEEIAAIAMALYEHLNAHDKEDAVLTINKVKRAYSPWSSKIYTLRELPRK